MKIIISDAELSVLKTMRAMAGCKRSLIEVSRLPNHQVYRLKDADYDIRVVIEQTNALSMSFLTTFDGNTKPIRSEFSIDCPLATNPLAHKDFLESDVVYGYGDSLIYSLDEVRLIASSLKPNVSYYAYQARPIKALSKLIKSKKGSLNWVIDEANNLFIVSDLGFISIRPTEQIDTKLEATITNLANSEASPLKSDVLPAYRDKLLDKLTLVGCLGDRIMVYSPPKKDTFIKLYTIAA